MEYDSIGHRGHYHFSTRLESLSSGVEQSYVDNLARFGVKEASLDLADYDAKARAVPVTLTLTFGDGRSKKKSWNQYIDESALDVDRVFLTAYVGAKKDEVDALLSRLGKGQEELKTLEPDVWAYLAAEYALISLPNEANGGEWTDRDEADAIERFELREAR